MKRAAVGRTGDDPDTHGGPPGVDDEPAGTAAEYTTERRVVSNKLWNGYEDQWFTREPGKTQVKTQYSETVDGRVYRQDRVGILRFLVLKHHLNQYSL